MPSETMMIFANAIRNDDADTVERILKDHPEFMQQGTGFGTFLHSAAHAGSLKVVQRLVALGMDVNTPQNSGQPEGPIWSAASEGHIDIVKWLLERGATSNCIDPSTGEECNFCLVEAVVENQFELVKLLVEYGANVNVHFANQAPLSMAEGMGHTKIADFLRKHGALTLEQIQAQQTKPKPKRKK